MMELPKSLKSFEEKAVELLGSGCVRDIEFSGGTYQVLVFDPKSKKEEWAFLQLDARGRLRDSFCSCKESETHHECIHQAVAFLYLFDAQQVPLHVRFEKSLWNILCRYCADTIGTRPDLLKVGGRGHYSLKASGGKILFSVKGRTPESIKRLEKIMFDRQHETEETSLKFSNLSIEELQLWRQGKPTNQLRYELSFWNDLAKLMMFWQEERVLYTISFGNSNRKIPNRIFIHFPEMEFDFFIPEADLPLMIPALGMVRSPLAIYSEPQEEIESIVYDKKQKGLIVTQKQKEAAALKPEGEGKGIDVDGWVFVPGDGFYLKQRDHALQAGVLKGKSLETALNEHTPLIREMIEGCSLYDSPTPLSYVISFDDHWNLHIEAYLFSPGDLMSDGSYSLGDWVYIEGKGFLRVEDRYFDNIDTVVAADAVADFVTDHRMWLNNQEGFRIHLSHMEADLSYRLTEDNRLTFSRYLTISDEGVKTKDFGRWVFVGGQGFFSKVSMQTSLPVRAGVSIAPNQISTFIRANRDELQLVTGFFSASCPVEKSGVRIELKGQEEIEITPEYTLLSEYRGADVRYFDEFVYVHGEGFYELPADKRLPERYRSLVVIDGEGLAQFLKYELPSIESIATYIDPRLRRSTSGRLLANSIEAEEGKEGEKYTLKLKFETEFGAIPVASLWWSFMKKRRFVFSEAGLIDLTEKRFSWLKTLKKDRVDRRGNSIELTTLELMRLNAFDEMVVSTKKDEVSVHSQQLIKELTQFRVPDAPDLAGLESHLRPYQEIGVNWLWFLYRHGLSGLLCDDMGLGKTHQAMALLVAVTNFLRKKETPGKKHFLVVCPTSVIYHWQEKLSAFLPGLKVWTFYGANRSLETFYEHCDILLTSYGIWRNEAEVLTDYDFEVAIFDEIQIAKNYTSRIYNALTRVKARMRLGLSGTPIENHLRELKTLFDITLPTYMPGETEYREYFVRPIEKEDSQERKELLSRLIKPFVMRRKKEDVLLDLPEKIEEIAHCDLHAQQHKMYTEVLTASRERIIDELSDEGRPIPYMHVFALLSHLKQICDHPAVYLKKPEQYKSYGSGKWDLFVELLSEARESQQKVVVFSQYLNMIDIIEEYLKEHGIDYATIRGSTVNRGEQLQRFKDDPRCEVFVASLQAAGLGVDLTSASVVIHYDRWWNAARERQATDRVHRIGQVRGVQVFKLMTKDTIEEHIDFLIAKKGKLMDDIVGVDDHQVIKRLERQEIMKLLQMLPS